MTGQKKVKTNNSYNFILYNSSMHNYIKKHIINFLKFHLLGPGDCQIRNKSVLFTWEKNILNKTNVSCSSKHSLFLDLFCKTKKTICIENIGFLGVLQKIFLLLQFHRWTKRYKQHSCKSYAFTIAILNRSHSSALQQRKKFLKWIAKQNS